MSKILRSFLAVFMFLALGIGLVACGNDKEVKSIYVDLNSQDEIQVKHKDGDWDPSDHLDVWARLGNNDIVDINEGDCTFEGLDINTVGRQTVTITYGSYECTVTVNVYKYIQSIAIVEGTIPTEVDMDGVLDTTEAKIKLIYSDFSTEEIDEGFTISSPSTDELGNITVEVGYQGFTTTTRIKVVDVISEYRLEGLETTYFAANSINYNNIVLVPVYVGGTVPEVSEYISLSDSGCNYTLIPTSEGKLVAGNHIFEATYNGFTATQNVRVVEYTAMLVAQPKFIGDYETQSKTQNTYDGGQSQVKGFAVVGDACYLVGDDNPFKFSPYVTAKYGVGDTEFKETLDFSIKADVYMDGEDVKLTDNLEEYVTINGEEHTFDFTEKAIDKQFKIVVTLDDIVYDNPEDANKSFDFEFKVVDGYNVHNAIELSVLDNSNVTTAFNGTKVGTKWNEFKTRNGISNDIRTKAIILHSNIKVTKDDLPDVHFFKENEVNVNDIDYNRVVGSLKDSQDTDPNGNLNLQFIYLRTVASNETFNIEGNFFQINLEELPLIVRADNGTNAGNVNESEDNAIITHTAVLGFLGSNDSMTTIMDQVTDVTYVPGNVNVNNIIMHGNAKKTNNVIKSGGVTAYKFQYVNFNAYNNLTQACYIAYFARGLDRTNSMLDEADKYEADGTLKTNITIRLNKVNAFDSYNTLIYLWGTSKLYIDSSKFIGAGGPVMICDHAMDSNAHGGYATNVYVDYNLLPNDEKTMLASWVVGEEGWFDAFPAAAPYIQMLKALDGLLRGVEAVLRQQMENDNITLPTILSGDKMNLVAVYKSGEIEDLSEREIKGSFKVHGYNGLDFSDPTVAKARQDSASAGSLCLMQSNNAVNPDGTNNCTFAAPGDNSNLVYAENLPALLTCEDYINVYLINGMAAILGLA